MDILGTLDLNAPARLAHDLLESKSIYERFKKLLGVDVPTPTNTIVIFLISDVVKVYGKGFDKCYGFYFEDAKTGEPIIVFSNKTFDQERHMGSTLAHEMFHAFQSNFTPLEKADTWKKFSLATLDVAPEDKRLPDTVGKFGGVASLKIKSSHGFKKIVLSKNGSGGSVAVIQGINTCYFHVTNDNIGPTVPAVRFDLGFFKNDSDQIYVQSVITFLDGHKVYGDWTGKEERLFCLNIESQCFTEIHTVISCSDSQKKKYKSFRISPAPTSRCYAATVVISRKLEEREIYEFTRTIDIATTETQSRSRSGKRWATLVLDLALDEKIHDQQHLAMDPVWLAKEATNLYTSGAGRIEKPVNKQSRMPIKNPVQQDSPLKPLNGPSISPRSNEGAPDVKSDRAIGHSKFARGYVLIQVGELGRYTST